jgi:hypothetical protein
VFFDLLKSTGTPSSEALLNINRVPCHTIITHRERLGYVRGDDVATELWIRTCNGDRTSSVTMLTAIFLEGAGKVSSRQTSVRARLQSCRKCFKVSRALAPEKQNAN